MLLSRTQEEKPSITILLVEENSPVPTNNWFETRSSVYNMRIIAQRRSSIFWREQRILFARDYSLELAHVVLVHPCLNVITQKDYTTFKQKRARGWCPTLRQATPTGDDDETFEDVEDGVHDEDRRMLNAIEDERVDRSENQANTRLVEMKNTREKNCQI